MPTYGSELEEFSNGLTAIHNAWNDRELQRKTKYYSKRAKDLAKAAKELATGGGEEQRGVELGIGAVPAGEIASRVGGIAGGYAARAAGFDSMGEMGSAALSGAKGYVSSAAETLGNAAVARGSQIAGNVGDAVAQGARTAFGRLTGAEEINVGTAESGVSEMPAIGESAADYGAAGGPLTHGAGEGGAGDAATDAGTEWTDPATAWTDGGSTITSPTDAPTAWDSTVGGASEGGAEYGDVAAAATGGQEAGFYPLGGGEEGEMGQSIGETIMSSTGGAPEGAALGAQNAYHGLSTEEAIAQHQAAAGEEAGEAAGRTGADIAGTDGTAAATSGRTGADIAGTDEAGVTGDAGLGDALAGGAAGGTEAGVAGAAGTDAAAGIAEGVSVGVGTADAAAVGGAAVAETAAESAAANWWNPFGWLAAAVAVGAGIYSAVEGADDSSSGETDEGKAQAEKPPPPTPDNYEGHYIVPVQSNL